MRRRSCSPSSWAAWRSARGSWRSCSPAHAATCCSAYAIVEGVIGLLGLVFHRRLSALTAWARSTRVIPALARPAACNSYKWTLGALLILPQSILLGMTFPLMSGGIVRRCPERRRRNPIDALFHQQPRRRRSACSSSGFLLIGWRRAARHDRHRRAASTSCWRWSSGRRARSSRRAVRHSRRAGLRRRAAQSPVCSVVPARGFP